ncbi:MAG: hypothetical protein WC750_04440 [Patescibacteria group bacterium]|jgi:CheY-like chemotaxis protein
MKKILVIDDSANNQASAVESLKDSGYEVTVVGTYDEAVKALGQCDIAWSGEGEPFEVVLCDLLMPAGKETMGPDGMEYVGQEMPLGFALAMAAVMHGAKYIGVVTDMNHHNHPASAAMDRFESHNTGARFVVNASTHRLNGREGQGTALVRYFQVGAIFPLEGTVCPSCNGSSATSGKHCNTCLRTGKQLGKNWSKVLKELLPEEKPQEDPGQ